MTPASRINGSASQLIENSLVNSCDFEDPQRDQLVEAIKAIYGSSILAILIYGSYLRGKRDTLLDFYVLLDNYKTVRGNIQSWLGQLLPPNVFQIHCGSPPSQARAKYALMTIGQFERAMNRDFHSYFWARFAQPCGVIYCLDNHVKQRLTAAMKQATCRFVSEVMPVLNPRFSWSELWQRGLTLTYQCELRSEKPGQTRLLVEYNASYYQSLSDALAEEFAGLEQIKPGQFESSINSWQRKWSRFRWGLRRVQGKVLSVLRIVKAALTFDDALDYLLWKIGRHSNIHLQATERQRKYPLLFAWPLLWRLYRRGAFR